MKYVILSGLRNFDFVILSGADYRFAEVTILQNFTKSGSTLKESCDWILAGHLWTWFCRYTSGRDGGYQASLSAFLVNGS